MAKKMFTGKVVSDKMTNTVIVAVELPRLHRLYKKLIKNTSRFKARNNLGVKLGDTVTISEIRHLSKTVNWEVVKNLTQEEK